MKERGDGLMEFSTRTLRFKDIKSPRGCTHVRTSQPGRLVPQLQNWDLVRLSGGLNQLVPFTMLVLQGAQDCVSAR